MTKPIKYTLIAVILLVVILTWIGNTLIPPVGLNPRGLPSTPVEGK